MRRRTFRDADGERVEGIWRHVFTRNGDTYLLTDLVVYADGAIDSGTGTLTDLDGLREQLRWGPISASLQGGARVGEQDASARHIATWRFTEPHAWIDADMLVGEVADEIDRLNSRPDSTDRCLLAVQAYLAEMTEENRLAVRDRYLAIPEHLRTYALGDLDHNDAPLRTLIADLGEPLPGCPDCVVTEARRAEAVDYFRDRELPVAEREDRPPADGPERAEAPTLTIYRAVYPGGWPAERGIEVLQNDYPAGITVHGRTYPSVTHAYWALSTSNPQTHDQIAAAPRAHDAVRLAEQAPRRTGWPAARLAVMAGLLRAKYTQHPRLAQTLLDTGDARIIYTDLDSAYWVASRRQGTNWIGRLLEVIRSELAAAEAGIPLHAVERAGALT